MMDDPNDALNPVTTANDTALFTWDPGAGFNLVLREGDSLAPLGMAGDFTGTVQVATTSNLEGGSQGLSDWGNGLGYLTMRIGGRAGTASPFTHSQAIVRMMVVPEPGTLSLLAASFGMMLRRRRA